MKQAQRMQKQMEEAQQELELKEFEVTSGGGAVKVVITGKKVINSRVCHTGSLAQSVKIKIICFKFFS